MESTPSNKAFGQMIEKVLDPVISNTSLNMDVIGFVDNTLMEKLESCAGRIRIICHDQKKNPREVQSAISRLLNVGAEIRSYREMHARLVLTNTQAVIGSGDLQADSLGANRTDACIWSNHPEILYDAKQFFEKIWAESSPVGDTLLYKSDFSKHQEGAMLHDPWRVNRGLGSI